MNTFSQIAIISMTTVCGVKFHAALFSYTHYLRAPYYLELFLNLETFHFSLYKALFVAYAGIVHRYISFIRAYMIVLIIFAMARAIISNACTVRPAFHVRVFACVSASETSTNFINYVMVFQCMHKRIHGNTTQRHYIYLVDFSACGNASENAYMENGP